MTETGTEIKLYERIMEDENNTGTYIFYDYYWNIDIDGSNNVTITYKGTESNITFIVDKDMTIQSYAKDGITFPKDLDDKCTVTFNEKIKIKKNAGNSVKLKINGGKLVIKNQIEIESDCELECSTLEIV